MSDELDRPGVAGEDEAGGVGAGARGQTTVATRPQRPTGKRTRQQLATVGAGDDGGTGTELLESTAEIDAEPGSKAKKAKESTKAKKAKKAGRAWTAAGLSRNPVVFPVVFVYDYLKQVVAELRKVIWPNRKQMITYTSVVLAFLVFMVALIAGADYGFAKLVLLVFGGDR